LLLGSVALLTAAARGQGDRAPIPPQVQDVVLVLDSAPRIADPKLAGGDVIVSFHVQPVGAKVSASLEILSSGALIDTVWSGTLEGGAASTQVAWDGRNTAGQWCDTGAYTIRISGPGAAKAERPLHVVRLGITELEAQDSPAGNDEWPMVYFMKGASYQHYATPAIHEYLNVAELGEISDLDLDNGDPRPVAAVHTATDEPALEGNEYEDDRYNYPLAYIRGASPRIELTMGDSATSAAGRAMTAGYPVAGFELRTAVRQDGGAPIYTAPITPGGTSLVDLATLPNEVLRVDTDLDLSWQYRAVGGSAWSDVAGATTIPLRIYTLLAEPNFASGAAGTAYAGPWVEVAEYITSWKATLGFPASNERELTEVHVQGFVGQNGGIPTAIEGVLYDAFPLGGDGGATHYFNSNVWGMNLSALLNSHAKGVYVNCTDNIGATTTMLAMMGVDNMRPLRLGPMQLKAIWGIGAPGYTTNLWGGGSHSFSYHHIVTNDDGVTVSDTCMQLDEDGDPTTTPGVPGWNHHRSWADVGGYDDLSSYNSTSWTALQSLPKVK
jgi:hypothetical protein